MWNQKNPYTKLIEKDVYTIGDITELYGIGADSLRYYERKGLIHPKRGENQYRYYDTWDRVRLNIIRSLRAIDLPVEEIGKFMENRTIQSTLTMLENVQEMIEERIRRLETFTNNLRTQINDIKTADSFLFDVITVNRIEDRPAFLLDESYITPNEYDIMRMKLARSNDLPFSVISNNQVGSAISTQRTAEGDYTTYDCMFALDPNGDFTIPGGIYLTIRYRGPVESEKHIRLLKDYAQRNGFRVVGPYLEWCYLDVHTTDLVNESVMENQVLVEVPDGGNANREGSL